MVVDAHRLDNAHPYLFKTADYGNTWTNLAEKLPVEVYLHAVREDSKRKGLLYVGTERGVAFSTDDGANWQQLKLNLPTVAVHDLIVKNNDLVVGTHGRSIWILDDLTPLREMCAQIAGADSYLFPVQAAARYRYHAPFHAKAIGQNPPPGAIVNYYLKAKPRGLVTLDILDDHGILVATLKSKPKKEVPDGPQMRKIEETPARIAPLPNLPLFHKLAGRKAVVVGSYWLSPTPDEPWTFGWAGTSFWRLVTWARLRYRDGTGELYAATTHVDNNHPNQEMSAPLLSPFWPATITPRSSECTSRAAAIRYSRAKRSLAVSSSPIQ